MEKEQQLLHDEISGAKDTNSSLQQELSQLQESELRNSEKVWQEECTLKLLESVLKCSPLVSDMPQIRQLESEIAENEKDAKEMFQEMTRKVQEKSCEIEYLRRENELAHTNLGVLAERNEECEQKSQKALKDKENAEQGVSDLKKEVSLYFF